LALGFFFLLGTDVDGLVVAVVVVAGAVVVAVAVVASARSASSDAFRALRSDIQRD
jgi:hypothetical protein